MRGLGGSGLSPGFELLVRGGGEGFGNSTPRKPVAFGPCRSSVSGFMKSRTQPKMQDLEKLLLQQLGAPLKSTSLEFTGRLRAAQLDPKLPPMEAAACKIHALGLKV